MASLWVLLPVLVVLARTGPVRGCVCLPATVLSRFPSEVPAGPCCLNFSGSVFGRVRWSVLTNGTSAETLDLSDCNISLIETGGGEGEGAGAVLQRVFLDRNRLDTLPQQFLAGQPGLTELDLSENLLQELPEGFLQDSPSLRRLDLRRNQLRSLPKEVLLLPGLQRLELDGNRWECSCLLLEGLKEGGAVNRTTQLQDLLMNLTCSSPRHLYGRSVWSLSLRDVCRPAGLTALFIVLPLLILSALLLCWCCGRKRKKKETPAFSSSKKRASSSGSNGHKHPSKLQPSAAKDGILLRPPADLPASNRDVYEEVEIKLSSAEPPPRVSSRSSSSAEERPATREPDDTGKDDPDAVSVTEVMKDSADREKAYLTQSTEYYNLVPGIELEDSDHGEYENVELS
ncbi:leucine-rich repeat-containing protein 26 [Kryptolebias marmoratus]|uniref:LRRCT domain-containing protein n=1 Tax=Kryptolebias marmoratus TaxID=37003 RepID=A0A3Q3GMF9_KRYMA|nr:leucine-rich repeat-containing protein 26 [Kryptolebias marmoratus]XP_037837684.1 leucine-rich repeat-containing protein 26 [Kryptolebias marmoratus]